MFLIQQENPDYPRTEELVANVQIATPVREAANHSPWVNFKDDQVVNWTRRIAGALPGNINAPGVDSEDQRGRGLASYLRVEESKNRIVQYIKDAYARLRYPIPFFQDAAAIEHPVILNHQVKGGFFATFFMGSKEITSVAKRSEGKGDCITQFTAQCRDLRPGDVEIRAESIVQSSREKLFTATGYVGNKNAQGGKVLRMTNPKEISRWRLGQVHVSKGRAKDPIEVDVRYLDQPLLAQ